MDFRSTFEYAPTTVVTVRLLLHGPAFECSSPGCRVGRNVTFKRVHLKCSRVTVNAIPDVLPVEEERGVLFAGGKLFFNEEDGKELSHECSPFWTLAVTRASLDLPMSPVHHYIFTRNAEALPQDKVFGDFDALMNTGSTDDGMEDMEDVAHIYY